MPALIFPAPGAASGSVQWSTYSSNATASSSGTTITLSSGTTDSRWVGLTPSLTATGVSTGQVLFTGTGSRSDGGAAGTLTPGSAGYYTYSWTAPAGVRTISVVAVGGGGGGGYNGGGGGGGGALAYINNYTVTPGNTYTVVAGIGQAGSNRNPGGTSYFNNTSTVAAGGGGGGLEFIVGSAGGAGGTVLAGTGFPGGGGGAGQPTNYPGGGGGAGGYTGAGGAGASGASGPSNGASSTGGGGGGGASGSSTNNSGGGGVGVLGAGSNGVGATSGGATSGTGGSGGSNGGVGYGTDTGGAYGGGGGGSNGAAGGTGAVRIIWGLGRSFPSTLTSDQTVVIGSSGSFAANTVITSVINSTSFTVNIAPTLALSGDGILVSNGAMHSLASLSGVGKLRSAITVRTPSTNPAYFNAPSLTKQIELFKNPTPREGAYFTAPSLRKQIEIIKNPAPRDDIVYDAFNINRFKWTTLNPTPRETTYYNIPSLRKQLEVIKQPSSVYGNYTLSPFATSAWANKLNSNLNAVGQPSPKVTNYSTVSSITTSGSNTILTVNNPSTNINYITSGQTYYGTLNGTSQYLSAAQTVGTITTGPFTIEAWVNPTTYSGGPFIIEDTYWNTGNNGGWYLQINTNGTILLGYSTATFNTYGSINSNLTLSAGVWSHVAVVRDINNFVSLYINGQIANSPTILAQSLNLNSGGNQTNWNTRIGCHIADGGFSNGFSGNISNVRIVPGKAVYTGPFTPMGPLSTKQPARQNVAALSGTETVLLALQSATVTTDASVNNFTLTNVGSIGSLTATSAVVGTVPSVNDYVLITDTVTNNQALAQISGSSSVSGGYNVQYGQALFAGNGIWTGIGGSGGTLTSGSGGYYTYTWTAPANVYSVSVVAVGGGGGGGSGGPGVQIGSGGGGGALAYVNNISVVPGQSYTVVAGIGGAGFVYASAGQSGGASYFINSSTLYVNGGGAGGNGSAGGPGGTVVAGTGGSGGSGGTSTANLNSGGGGGAGGYSGSGGTGGTSAAAATAGSGGGGAGGQAYTSFNGGGGGGTSVAASSVTNGAISGSTGGGNGGGGGSGGTAGANGSTYGGTGGVGGLYGGGGGGAVQEGGGEIGGFGGIGAVRIIWPAVKRSDASTIRAFPTTLATDQTGIAEVVGSSNPTITLSVPTASVSNLNTANTWAFSLWDPEVFQQSNVVTNTAPATARDNLYYTTLAPGKYGNYFPNKTAPGTPSATNYFTAGKLRSAITVKNPTANDRNYLSAPTMRKQIEVFKNPTPSDNIAYRSNNINRFKWVSLNPTPKDGFYFDPNNLQKRIEVARSPAQVPANYALSNFAAPYTYFNNANRIAVGTFNGRNNFTTSNSSSISTSGANTLVVVNKPVSAGPDPIIGDTFLLTDTVTGIQVLAQLTSISFITLSIGQTLYDSNTSGGVLTPGTNALGPYNSYTWTAPTGVTSVSVVAVGAGGSGGAYGGSGGSLAYKNNITVIPGNNYTVRVGLTNNLQVNYLSTGYYNFPAGDSYFGSTTPLVATGGQGGYSGTGIYFKTIGSGYDGGGRGGIASSDVNIPNGSYGPGAGGGAGGYSGDGGNAGYGGGTQNGGTNATPGSGGGGGGGTTGNGTSGGGGGVGVYGIGSSGAAGITTGVGATSVGSIGLGGSNGTSGSISPRAANASYGGTYGGGSGGTQLSDGQTGIGGSGAVRIIWPGTTRSFPSTLTTDQSNIQYTLTFTSSSVSNLNINNIWAVQLWEADLFQQANVLTITAPTNARERLYYANLVQGRYGQYFPAKATANALANNLTVTNVTRLKLPTVATGLYANNINIGKLRSSITVKNPTANDRNYLSASSLRKQLEVIKLPVQVRDYNYSLAPFGLSSFSAPGSPNAIIAGQSNTKYTGTGTTSSIVASSGNITITFPKPAGFNNLPAVGEYMLLTDTATGNQALAPITASTSPPVGAFNAPQGQTVFTTSTAGGTYYPALNAYQFLWQAPSNVYRVAAVAIGGGGGGANTSTYSALGGGGGALAYTNNIPVVPGNTYTVQVGAGGTGVVTIGGNEYGGAGGASYFKDESTVKAIGGSGGLYSLATIQVPLGQAAFDGGGNYSGTGATYVSFTTGGGQSGGGYYTYSWTCPANIYSVSVVAVGGGGGGGGGACGGGGGGGGLAYGNNIPVTPGTVYTVVAGQGGRSTASNVGSSSAYGGYASYFKDTSTLYAAGGSNGTGAPGTNAASFFGGAGGGYSGTYVTGGGTGGAGSQGNPSGTSYQGAGAGGGAGGYGGSGGAGGQYYPSVIAAGTGVNGGGGGGSQVQTGNKGGGGGGGGGVGLNGQGSNGAGGILNSSYGDIGLGGSGGGSGGYGSSNNGNTNNAASGGSGGGAGGGGGGSGGGNPNVGGSYSGSGGAGAVRIIWPAVKISDGSTVRAFPTTLTADQSGTITDATTQVNNIPSAAGGTYVGTGGGNGGNGGQFTLNNGGGQFASGGGGAGGYSGAGGAGGGSWGNGSSSATVGVSTAGTGGAGGGGGATGYGTVTATGGAGGGVGVLGTGSSGAAGSVATSGAAPTGGAGATNGGNAGGNGSTTFSTVVSVGGAYGGGGGGVINSAAGSVGAGAGAPGAVRLIWPSNKVTDNSVVRAFPGTAVNDQSGTVADNTGATPSYVVTIPSAYTTSLNTSNTWTIQMWEANIIPQLNVKTNQAPTTARERLYYDTIAPGKYGQYFLNQPLVNTLTANNVLAGNIAQSKLLNSARPTVFYTPAMSTLQKRLEVLKNPAPNDAVIYDPYTINRFKWVTLNPSANDRNLYGTGKVRSFINLKNPAPNDNTVYRTNTVNRFKWANTQLFNSPLANSLQKRIEVVKNPTPNDAVIYDPNLINKQKISTNQSQVFFSPINNRLEVVNSAYWVSNNIPTGVLNSKYNYSATSLGQSISGQNTILTLSNISLSPTTNDYLLMKDNTTSNQALAQINSVVSNAAAITNTYYGNFTTSSRLTIAANAAFSNFGTGPFSVEFWYNLPTIPTASDFYPLGCWDLSGGYSWYITLRTLGATRYYDVGLWLGGTYPSGSPSGYSSSVLSGGTGAISTNTWYHFAISRTGGTLKMFHNGQQIYSAANTDNIFNVARLDFNAVNTINYVNCLISNVRIVKGIGVYTGAFTVPTNILGKVQSSSTNIQALTGTETSLLTLQSASFVDNSNNAFTFSTNTSVTLLPLTGNYQLSVASSSVSNLTVSNTWTAQLWDPEIIQQSSVRTNLPPTTARENLYYSQLAKGSKYAVYFPSKEIYNTLTNNISYGAVNLPRILLNSKNTLFNAPTTSNMAVFDPSTWTLSANTNQVIVGAQSPKLLNNTTISTQSTVGSTTVLTVNNPSSTINFMTSGSTYYGSFNGSTQYLTVADSFSLQPGSSNYTVEAWFYQTATGGANGASIVSKANPASLGPFLLQINGSQLRALVSTDGSTWAFIISGPTISLNTWYHVALVRNGSTFTLYLNGASSGTGTVSGTVYNASGYALMIGNGNYATAIFTGYISNVRVVIGTAVYTSNFIPLGPLSIKQPARTNVAALGGPEVSLLTLQNSTIINNSSNLVPQPTYIPTATYGGSFSGNAQYLSTASSANFNLNAAANFTVEAWIYILPGNTNTILSLGTGGSAYWWTLQVNTDGTLSFATGTGGWAVNTTYNTVANAVPNYTWTHVAAVKTGNSFNMYINGNSVYSSATYSGASGQSGSLYIGTYYVNYNNDGSWFRGYISNLRIVNNTAVYTGPFIPLGPLSTIQSSRVNVSALTGTETILLALQS